MKKLLISAAIVAGAAFGISGQAQAACGEFQMSDMKAFSHLNGECG